MQKISRMHESTCTKIHVDPTTRRIWAHVIHAHDSSTSSCDRTLSALCRSLRRYNSRVHTSLGAFGKNLEWSRQRMSRPCRPCCLSSLTSPYRTTRSLGNKALMWPLSPNIMASISHSKSILNTLELLFAKAEQKLRVQVLPEVTTDQIMQMEWATVV